MTTMKAAFAKPESSINDIEIREIEIPAPQAGEALVRLKAATLNYRDLLALRGKVNSTKTPEYVPLSDAVGEVVATGEGVTRVASGDRVSPLFAQGWLTGPTPSPFMLGGPVDGVARQYATFDAESLCLIPDEIGDLEAATLPCAGLTAWTALFGHRPLQPGEWILTQGTGGVSLAALQWAKAVGAKVIMTSSSDAKLRRARALGADVTINYRKTADWPAAARAATNGRGVDIFVDLVGASQVADGATALAENGLVAAIGRLEGTSSYGMDIGKRLAPIVVGNRDGHEAMLKFCADKGIRPVIDTVYDLERLADAMRLMDTGDFFGKIGINLL